MECSMFDGDQSKCHAVTAMRKVTASLSLIGCLFMIIVIWLFKKYIVFSQRLILYLSISALFDCIQYLMPDYTEDGPGCNFQAWAGTYFDWTVLLWVVCITFNLYMNAIKMTATDKYEWAYHILSWGLPLIISFLPFINNHYGPAGMWCWIVDNWAWRFGIWYAPLFLIIGALFFAYTYIIIMVNRKVQTWEGMYDPDVERSKQLMKEDVKPLRLYPFVYLAVSIFPLINRIQNAVSAKPVFALVLLHAITSPLQGVLNSIVFGLDRETRSKLTIDQMKVALFSHAQTTSIHEYDIHEDNPEETIQQDDGADEQNPG